MSTSTKIIIPGREAQIIPGMAMSADSVKAAYAGTLDLSAYNVTEVTEGDVHVVTFTNRTGTKGTDTIINDSAVTINNTIIMIPGREAQTIPGMVMEVADVQAAYAGQVDLRPYNVAERFEGESKIIAFTNRTGTKGTDTIINDSEVTINNTIIMIPGREAQTIPGMVMEVADVQAAYAGQVDLRPYNVAERFEGESKIIAFTNRTGTKGNDLFAQILAAAQAQAVAPEAVAQAAPVFTPAPVAPAAVELKHTKILVPGREAQIIPDMVMDASSVRAAYAGTLDLSAYNVTEDEAGDTLVVTFTNRTGTKGKAAE